MHKIGNVFLDESHYQGKDFYSDGEVEERILKLTAEYGEREYNKLIAKEREWAVMYHLAHERGNILSWYPFAEGAKVLEVGSGCGAVTGTVAARVGSVTCIDLSKRRSTINAQRNRERDNIKICIGNFKDIEKDLEHDFDYATLIGVFEYGMGYIGGKKPYHEFLRTIMEHLKPGGKLLLAIENKFGLKYWAGCTEDHVGRIFEGIEGYPGTEGVRTFTRQELIRIIEACGCSDYHFYYPYPDYKIPLTIYSDAYLPKRGELQGNFCNFDRPRLMLMDEGRAYDQILEDGLFGLYANSFFVEICKEPRQENAASVIYTKYSNGRAPEFAIQTRITAGGSHTAADSAQPDIMADNAQNRQIYKVAEYEEGKPHIRHIAQAAEALRELWKQKGIFQVNRCWLEGERVYFEYLEGVTLEETLDQLLEQRELEQAMAKLKEAVRWIMDAAPTSRFVATPEFAQVFGETKALEGAQAVEAADIDMIFSNLLLDGEGKCHVLDYEWTFFFPVPVGFLVYRALHYYLESAPKRGILENYMQEYTSRNPSPVYPEGMMDPLKRPGYGLQGAGNGSAQSNEGEDGYQRFYEYFGISWEMREVYARMEQNFQKYKGGGYASVGELYRMMGKAALSVDGILQEAERRRIQVYLDTGQGFSEDNSYFIDVGFHDRIFCCAAFPPETKGILIDPAFSPCIIRNVKLQWEDDTPASYGTTGIELTKGSYLFDNADPKIAVTEIPQGREHIKISYQISFLDERTAALLLERMDMKGRIKEKFHKLIKG